MIYDTVAHLGCQSYLRKNQTIFLYQVFKDGRALPIKKKTIAMQTTYLFRACVNMVKVISNSC